jgi:DNA processing protein
MPLEADALAWITLSRTPRLSVANLAGPLNAAGSAASLIRVPASRLEAAGVPLESRAYWRRAEAAPNAMEIRWLEHPSHRIIGFIDPRFPPLLRTIRECPIALYVCGNEKLLHDPQIAVVGSRNPTAGGRDHAFEFSRSLAGAGITVTSGLAEGIDSAAHRGALAAPAPTIAVLGTGIDVIYPPGNRALFEQIADSGALVGEFPLQTPGRAVNFPQRNRIIAALALGTLVVEAARRSGSLITARLAGDYGREIFAIPGSIHNLLSQGCHQLIQQGAKLTETADDILSELNFSRFLDASCAAPCPPQSTPSAVAPMDKDRKILLDALGFEPTTLDTLTVRSGFDADAVSSMMLVLELEGHVQRGSAGRYARVARSS